MYVPRSASSYPLTLPSSACAQFTPNGQYIISSALSSTIRLWDYRSAKVIKSYTGHRGAKFGGGVVVVDAQLGGGDEEEEEGREVKRRRVEETAMDNEGPTADLPAEQEPSTAPQTITEATYSSTEPIQQTHPAPPPADTSDTAYIITCTDTATAIIYDLQSRRIIQRLNPRAPATSSSDSAAAEAAGMHTDTQKDTAAEGDEDEACLAVGAHPFRRELAIGALGDGNVVRVWRDYR